MRIKELDAYDSRKSHFFLTTKSTNDVNYTMKNKKQKHANFRLLQSHIINLRERERMLGALNQR